MKYVILFLLLGGNGIFSQAKKLSVEDYFRSVSTSKETSIELKDDKNGYIKFGLKLGEGYGEFVIWKTSDQKVLAGMISYGCGPACEFNGIQFYEFTGKNTKGKIVTEKVFSEKKMKAFYEKHLDKIQARGAAGDETLWVKLPQKGKDIEYGIMTGQMDSEVFQRTGLGRFNGKKFDIISEIK